VWHGNLDARVPRSPLADRDMARLGRTVNLLLDGLTEDRARMRRLAAQVIGAGDAERSRLARELHDSTAQTLAALAFQVSAAARDSRDPELADRLATIKELTTGVLEEVRLLAHTVYPRVLDDLGLPAALHNLARQAGERDARVAIEVDAAPAAARLPTPVAAALYRVAQEAITNALRHAGAQSVHVRVAADERTARLDVIDDGRGFDVAEAERRRPGMGLFSMRERVSLVDGTFDVLAEAGAGTHVRAIVPIPTDTRA
jgi:signal transduction histidine kinase